MTKAELLAAVATLKDDDEILIAVLNPSDDDEDAGFSETETAPKADDASGEDEDRGYVEYPVDNSEVVEAVDNSGSKALLLYVDLDMPEDSDEDDIFVNDEGHYVDKDDNYITKEGEPSDVPVTADPEDMPKGDDA